MTEKYRLRVVPDPLSPPPSQLVGTIGCWVIVVAFGAAAYVIGELFIEWVLRR